MNTKQLEDSGRGGSALSAGLGLDAMRPACWTLTTTLDAAETTTRGFVWFTNPQNSAWEPLYRAAAIERVLKTARAFEAHRDEMHAELMFARRVLFDMMQTGVAQQTLWALRGGQGTNTKEGDAWLAAASFAKAAGEALKALDEQA